MTVEEDMLLTVKKLWEEGKFYEAHEVLEDIWRLFPRENRLSRNCYQGIIRLAIACYHYTYGRKDSALRVLRKVHDQLRECPKNFRYIDVDCMLSFVSSSIEALERGEDIKDFPRFPLNYQFDV
ncbi:MAG: DUF309 domain-containing protein [Hydrogenobacter sp.]